MGSTPGKTRKEKVAGSYVSIGNEKFYCISNYDLMEPFFMSIVSDSDHWLFISSKGGLTAGRKDCNNALFPYYAEDKIHDNSHNTGSRTLVRVAGAGKRFIWEPFSIYCGGLYDIQRNLYKNIYGNKLVFEEINRDLCLTFRYNWMTSDKFGFIKHAEIMNTGAEGVEVELLDGMENILPWGVMEFFQNYYSCLGDAYKQNECDAETGLGIFAYSSIPGDSAEPSEALRATVAWSSASTQKMRLVSSLQLDAFRQGGEIEGEAKVCGRRGAYFIHDRHVLEAGGTRDWDIIADVDYGLTELVNLKKIMAETSDIKKLLHEDVERGTRNLVKIVAGADGLQATGDRPGSTHHFSNVLFNVMRGGTFESSYLIPVEDLKLFMRSFNGEVYSRHEAFLGQLGENIHLNSLVETVREIDDPDLIRLVHEYLPLSFSRRHGDPSRPWNKFEINVKKRDGSKVLNYQGNWRDIFQNWEALCLSYPEFLENIICKFVNTTSADGYNPYRITKKGYEWETPNPDEPWANIGYWGDHQLIYLLKFLEMSLNYHPERLKSLLCDNIFVYADIPYDIKPYEDLLKDPRKSIAYSREREDKIASREKRLGFDGKYAVDRSGRICKANLTEKLLVTLLSKVSNFIPGSGFWMNTQRPEWNDANNALAGYGVSMVTLAYARRFVNFCKSLFGSLDMKEAEINSEVKAWFDGLSGILREKRSVLEADSIDDHFRKSFLDRTGPVAEKYRFNIYQNDFSGDRTSLSIPELLEFFTLLLEYFDHTVRINRRKDGLYHAYNVMTPAHEGISSEHLYEMLEGQVAALSSGCLGPEESISVLKSLRTSRMYREDQHSYILYPDRSLPSFMEKNIIPPAQAGKSELFQKLVSEKNTDLVEKDIDGNYHFNSLFKNRRDVLKALDRLKGKGFGELVEKETGLVSRIFESVFNHREFTGRSGTFYGYEGLGCIYWHMVSKLLLAVQECCFACGADKREELAGIYYDVRSGLGFNKPPETYGAFPEDPYSHTPSCAGAKQPGLTGQVKEEVITRLGELGLRVINGKIHFNPMLLRKSEFLADAQRFDYINAAGQPVTLNLVKDTLSFTYCQVPVVYHLSEEKKMTVHFNDDQKMTLKDTLLDADLSGEIFRRTGRVVRLDVFLKPGLDI